MSISEQIRVLAREGLTVAEIASQLNIRYQFAYGVLRKAGLLASKTAAPTIKPISSHKQPLPVDELIKALDPEWKGPQPHTVLLEPGGKVAWRHTGAISETELLYKILGTMTETYQPEKK